MAWQANTWLEWQEWQNCTTANTNVWAYAQPMRAAPAKPKDETPLEWLRRRVEEVTELAA